MFQIAEVAVPRLMFHNILRLIAWLWAPLTPACEGLRSELGRQQREGAP
jgi:hypothetical protein